MDIEAHARLTGTIVLADAARAGRLSILQARSRLDRCEAKLLQVDEEQELLVGNSEVVRECALAGGRVRNNTSIREQKEASSHFSFARGPHPAAP